MVGMVGLRDPLCETDPRYAGGMGGGNITTIATITTTGWDSARVHGNGPAARFGPLVNVAITTITTAQVWHV